MGGDHNEHEVGADSNVTPLLDHEQIDGLVTAAGVDGAREILDTFWRSCDGLIAELREQLGKGDLDDASRTAHALKGSSLNVGAMRLSLAARGIEDACRAQDPAMAKRRLSNIEMHYAETAAAFDAHLAA
ncbi:MAG: Hpt domain-containing protein [Amphiplicatus sp.]